MLIFGKKFSDCYPLSLKTFSLFLKANQSDWFSLIFNDQVKKYVTKKRTNQNFIYMF